ncbi:MAG: hypothetical protein J1E01_01295 [Acetatifactor sp.]|nr:hypothetical protein [Acetatifactor sp.]
MAMEQLLENVMKEVQQELDRANGKFPLFNSSHEGYAVILEKAEETKDALDIAKLSLNALWNNVEGSKLLQDTGKIIHPEAMAYFAFVACEAIQTAAMCLKYWLYADQEKPEEGKCLLEKNLFEETGGSADE